MADKDDEAKVQMLGSEENQDLNETLDTTQKTSEEVPLTEYEIGQPKPNGNKKTEVTGATAIIEEGRDDEVVLDQDAQSPHLVDPDAVGRCMFFKDGIRRIDYILAWTVDLEGKPEELAVSKEARSTFEENLRNEKLELEYDVREGEEVHFVKIHAPFDVLARYAEILKIRVPVKKTVVLENIQKKYARLEQVLDTEEESAFQKHIVTPMTAVSTRMWDTVTGMFKKVYAPFQLDENIFSKKERNFSLTYSKDKEYLFDNENKDKFFDNACRSRIVNFILRRKGFSSDKSQAFSFGVNKMIQEGHYSDAYPLHEGHWKATSANNARKRLFDYWAHWRNMFKVQPLDYIREYYGEKIAMYFTWLGFYTQMLIPASVVGLIVFIYGCIIAGNSYPVTEVCDKTKTFNMCPLCDFQCPYWNLSDTCDEVAASRIFDNGATVFFAIFMSLWGTLFLEFWKRKQAKFQYKWELTDFVKEEQPPRPEYLSRLEHVTTYKEDPVTGIREPHLPFWRKRVPIYLMSWTVMLFLACLAIIAVIGVIAYRVSTLAALQILTREKPAINSTLIASTTEVIYQNASMLTSITAACINLIIIIILNMIYKRLAFWLTDLECLRTQKEYDDSITLKLFALQFVNYYSSIFYIAFFKGRIVGRPGKYNTLFGARQEECGAGGCLIELCIQLAIIMTGKQLVVNNIMEIVIPKLIKWIKRKILKESKEKKMNKPPWEKDYLLESAQHTSLFYEYLEMVLQFGFLTIFVAAFPLGPLFALINNILEIRFDAIKFITQLRRPLAERIPDIGIWYSVLYGISRIAIMTNAFIISLTSDFIPRLVYEMSYSPDGTLAGYMNYTLSYFNTSDFHKDNAPYAPGVTVCRYRDFRKPPWDDDKYEYSEMYWHVLAARLAFVVVFENLIVITTGFISWLIPDVPAELKLHVRREAYITNEIIIKTELLRAQGEEIKDDTLRAIVENENKKFTVQEGNTEEGGALRYRSSAMGSMTLEKSPDHMV